MGPGTARMGASRLVSRAPGCRAAGSRATQHTGPAFHPRAQTRKQAPRSTPSRAFPWSWEANQTHAWIEGDPGNWPGGRCGPLPALLGHGRCEQMVPDGSLRTDISTIYACTHVVMTTISVGACLLIDRAQRARLPRPKSLPEATPANTRAHREPFGRTSASALPKQERE